MWNVPDSSNSQLDAEINMETKSDPICNSAGCTQYKHPDSKEATWPMDYYVPNFGMDRDISGSIEDQKAAEQIIGHKWTWKEKKKPKVV